MDAVTDLEKIRDKQEEKRCHNAYDRNNISNHHHWHHPFPSKTMRGKQRRQKHNSFPSNQDMLFSF